MKHISVAFIFLCCSFFILCGSAEEGTSAGNDSQTVGKGDSVAKTCSEYEDCGEDDVACLDGYCYYIGEEECEAASDCEEQGARCEEAKCNYLMTEECAKAAPITCKEYEDCGEEGACLDGICYYVGEEECQATRDCQESGSRCQEGKCHYIQMSEDECDQVNPPQESDEFWGNQCTSDSNCPEGSTCFSGRCI